MRSAVVRRLRSRRDSVRCTDIVSREKSRVTPSGRRPREGRAQRKARKRPASGRRRRKALAVIAPSPRTTEKQKIAIGVLELEATQPVICVSQRLEKFNVARSKFGCQCVRIGDDDERVPA